MIENKKSGFNPQYQLTQSERLYSKLLEAVLGNENKQIDYIWNDNEGLTTRLFYDAGQKTFFFGPEATFSTEGSLGLCEGEVDVAVFEMADYETKEQFLRSVLLAWEYIYESTIRENSLSVSRSDFRVLAEALSSSKDVVLDSWMKDRPGGKMETFTLKYLTDEKQLVIVSDRVVTDSNDQNEPDVLYDFNADFKHWEDGIHSQTKRRVITDVVRIWYDVSPNKELC